MQPSYVPPTHRVLWVDDNPDNNRPLADDLMRAGIHVSYALTTGLALTLLARNRYLAVISDMGRCEGAREGFHLLDMMRARGDLTPYFIFSSLSAPALSDEAALHDAQGCTNNGGELVGWIRALLPGPVSPSSATPSRDWRADPFDLDRFVDAQARRYATALLELRRGRKRSHWIWYVFPQLRGLGFSANASLYGLTGLREAHAYVAHPVLGPRLRECVEALMTPGSPSAQEVLGELDAMKLWSSLTLFAAAVPGDPLFRAAIERHFGGQADPRTTAMLADASRGA